jgi:hypothetical protein
MKTKISTFFVAEDPGGFNALFPLIKHFHEEGLDYTVVLDGACRLLAQEQHIKFLDAEGLDDATLFSLLQSTQPKILVCGVSHDTLSIDKRLIALAKRSRIKTLVVMDYWKNYSQRFSNPGTNDRAYLPDGICVIDDYMKKEMVTEGFDPAQLHITGNPFFETFGKVRKRDGTYILFASQPFSETKEAPFDEVLIFEECVSALRACGSTLPIVIAFHPREQKRDKFNRIINESKMTISHSTGPIEHILPGAEIVIGIQTMPLFQAALMGKKTISYQPGMNKENDILVSNHLGLSVPVYTRKELQDAICSLLSMHGLPASLGEARKRYVESSPTLKVFAVINKLLSLS